MLQHVKDRGWNILGTAGVSDDENYSLQKTDVDSYRSKKNTLLLLGK
jgi:hypothetical protein